MQRRGTPDIIGTCQGVFFGFEVKDPVTGKLSMIQKSELEKIRRAGGVASVVTSVDCVKALISGIREAKKT